jgi:hypothetical protein
MENNLETILEQEIKNVDTSFVELKTDNLELSKNIIQFRNKFVNLPQGDYNNNQLAMTVVSELMQFGFLLDESAIENISSASEENIVNFHNEIVTFLKKATGSNRTYTPFWKGFPQEVMQKTELELWIHQITHYMSNGTYEPNEWTRERPTAFEQPNYTVITAGDEDKFLQIFTDLVSVNQSLTDENVRMILWFVENKVELKFPNTIPFKENLCRLAGMGLDVPVKTVTDVLRIATFMSGGDVTLPKVPEKMVRESHWTTKKVKNPAREKFKFKKFSRKERRLILNLLEQTNCDASEATLKEQRWLRLGEILHPGEYKSRFPKAFEMFKRIRNEKVDSWYSQVNKSFESGLENGLKKLSERPGEFFRRLDALIRNNSNQKDLVLRYMNQVAGRVSNKVLFENYEHFEKRRNPQTTRSIMIPGARSRVKLPDLTPLSEHTVNSIQLAILNSLTKKFSELPDMGKIWIDEELRNIPMPKNMRSSSFALKPTVRGQRTPIGNQNSKVIRAFVHWFDEVGNQDIDLSGVLLGPGKIQHIGWNGTKTSNFGCYSGDIRHRKGACAEYVDINVQAALDEGFKYVVLDACNYNGRSFETVTDCVVGYMEREFPEANMNFVPSTISNCMRLQNESSHTIPSVIDLENREYIHLDIDKNGIPVASSDFQGMLDAIEPYCEPPAFSVYDLIEIHAKSRNAEIVENSEDAETTYNYGDFSESYVETLKLMGI